MVLFIYSNQYAVSTVIRGTTEYRGIFFTVSTVAQTTLKSYSVFIVDVDVDGVYECRPKPLCPHLEITLRSTKLLKFLTKHFTTTSGSLQLCSNIIYNILIVPKFFQSSFKCVSGVSRNNPVR